MSKESAQLRETDKDESSTDTDHGEYSDINNE